jgi:hypothetical protein
LFSPLIICSKVFPRAERHHHDPGDHSQHAHSHNTHTRHFTDFLHILPLLLALPTSYRTPLLYQQHSSDESTPYDIMAATEFPSIDHGSAPASFWLLPSISLPGTQQEKKGHARR